MTENLTRQQRYYLKHQERLRQKARDKRAADPEKYKGYVRKWKAKNPDRERVRNLAQFGLTIEDYDAMYEAQGGVCAICKQPETSQRDGKVYRLAVDHNHNTGQVRGLLCFKCNSAMGSFEKRGIPLENVIRFLERESDCD
jgi:5-methylcytosine-specific restriction endonuclease McrA